MTRRSADLIESMRVDRDPVERPLGKPLSGSDLLSAELDTLVRDPVYEAAAKAASA